MKTLALSRSRRRLRLCLATLALAVLFLGASPLRPAGAATSTISRSYTASGSVSTGSLVSLDSAHDTTVVAANTSNAARLLGIVVGGSDSLLSVSSNTASTSSVQVVTGGIANGLVSTVNGAIAAGDPVAVSSFNGIGMKARAGDRVIGLAQTAFSASTAGAQTQTVTSTAGTQSKIAVGLVRISINVGSNGTSVQNLSSVQQFGKSITGHVVSTPRIVASLVVAAIGLIAIVALTYSSIYSSIISIGRNPLAKFAVFRTLGSVLGMVLIIGVICATIIFLLLH